MKTRLNEGLIKIGKFTFTFADIAALLVFIAAAVFFAVNARYGSNEADETLYQTVCYRLSRGDKLFADDWMFITSAYFQYIPYRIACLICGGTEGIILVLRYFYLAVKMLFFIYIYCSLRNRGFWAVLAAALYCGTDLFGMKTMDFYSICANAALITGVILFVRRYTGPLPYVFAGFVFSCAVIVQPGTALVWAGYCVLVLAVWFAGKKGKKVLSGYEFILSPRVWRYLLFGVLGAAALFFIVSAAFFTGTDIKAILLGIGQLLELFGRRTAAGYSLAWIRLNKPVMYAVMYQPVMLILFLVLLAAACILPRKNHKLEKPLFCALFLLFIGLSVHLILYPVESTGNTVGESCSHPLLLCLLAVPLYARTKEKDRSAFAFLMFSFALSLAVDIFSNNTFGSVLLVGDIPAVLLLRDYVREQSAPAPEKKKKPLKNRYAAVLYAFVAFIAAFEVWHYGYMTTLPALEARLNGSYAPLDTVVSAGVYKGAVTTAELSAFCEQTARDAARAGAICEKGLYVADYDVTAYLSADADVYSPWAQVFQNWQGEEVWWQTHGWPDVVYIPYSALSYEEDVASAEEKLAYFRSKGEFRVERGEAGYILKLISLYPAG